jgi:hypothetical protein
MNKLGQYDDGRSNYNFSFGDGDGKHISVSFRAEPDYDLDIIFQEFRNFLIATGHDVEGQIGELHHEEDDWTQNMDDDEEEYLQSWDKDADDILLETIDAMKQERAYRQEAVQNFLNPTQDKFSMDHLPNNGWPFGGLTTTALPSITSLDLAGIKSIDLSSINQFPTMSPITSEQIASWNLPTQQQINSWRVDAPGTIGGAKVTIGGLNRGAEISSLQIMGFGGGGTGGILK